MLETVYGIKEIHYNNFLCRNKLTFGMFLRFIIIPTSIRQTRFELEFTSKKSSVSPVGFKIENYIKDILSFWESNIFS